MQSDDIIKTTGTIVKEETMVNIEHNILSNTLVLESSHPFPGYHGSNLPEKPSPNSIYLITEKKYEGEDILRASKKIKEVFHDPFDATFGKIEIFSNTYHFIRVKNLVCFDCIAKIQKAYTGTGINFMKKKRVIGKALIKIQKFFFLQKIHNHLYKDLKNPLLYYFEISDRPDWDFFKKITIYIRSNIDKYSFDAALGVIYQEEIQDVIRIYAKDITKEQLLFIRKKYLYEFSHPDHLD